MPYDEIMAEMPKVTDNQQESIYLPLADYLNAGIVRPSEKYFRVLPDGTLVPDGSMVILQEVKTVQIYENGNFIVKPDAGYNAVGNVLLEINVPIPDITTAIIPEWDGSIAYEPDAIVIFDNVYYVCIKATAEGAMMQNPSVATDEWERLNGSYKGAYSETESYNVGDIVEKNGAIYQSNVDNPQTTPDNNMVNHWTKLYEYSIPEGYIKPSGTLTITENGTHDVTNYASANVNVSGGGAYQGEYADSTTYAEGDIVKSDGNVYRSLQNDNIGNTPANYIGMFWEQLNTASGGSGAYKGEYSGYDYEVGDIVTYKGNVYRCLQKPVEGMPEPDSPYVADFWEQLNSKPTDSKTVSAGTYRLSYTALTNVASIPSTVSIACTVSGTAYSESDTATVSDITSISVFIGSSSLGAYVWKGSNIVFNTTLSTASPVVVTINSDITVKGFWFDLFNLISERI